METNFNFKSQICTTREQSERLLALGLKKETADMVYTNASLPYYKDVFHVICKEYSQLNKEVNCEISPFSFIPAWSLHRLIEMMPNVIGTQGWLSIGHQGLHYSRGYGVADDGLYESIVRMYEWLIKEGYFNKEYLSAFKDL